MRLAFVLHHYFPHGGLQRDAYRIAEACQTLGYQVEFLTMAWQGSPLPNSIVSLLPQKNICNYQRYQAFSAAVQQHTQRYSYAAVIGFNKMAGLDVYYAADPCFAAVLAKRRWRALYKWLPRYRSLLATEAQVANPQSKTHIFLISPQAVMDFQHYYHTPKEQLHFLSPGVAHDRRWHVDAPAQRSVMRNQLGYTPEKKIILMLGSGFKTKGVDRGIRALAALPKPIRSRTELLIVGKGDSVGLLRLARHLQVAQQVQVIPGSDQIPALLFAADLLLHPAYLENTGTAILEAIVAGLPVLTTANCGYAFYVAQAQAGVVLAEPFVQQHLNEQLASMLHTIESNGAVWHNNAVRFGQEQDLYSLPSQAAQLITTILQEKNH